jgi:cyclophilin family peptidyl-prolyl cis-trans isomerase/HEAT repeat protein
MHRSMPRPTWILVTLAALAACDSRPELRPEPAPLEAAEDAHLRVLARIAFLEDRRSDGGGELEILAASSEPEVQERALLALGRMPFPELTGGVSAALVRALSDKRTKARAIAAFGLGLRADPATAGNLLSALSDPSAEVRARAVEAASRFDNPGMREELLYASSDPSPLVRAEAALAPHRWSSDDANSALVDSALVGMASAAPAKLLRERWGIELDPELKTEPEDIEVVWRALFSLARRKAERGREVFYLWARAPESVNARIFAVRGIGALATSDPRGLEILRESIADSDARVALEAARGLGRFPNAASLDALKRATRASSSALRGAAASALGEFEDHRENARKLLEKPLVDTSTAVRAAATVATAKLMGDGGAAELELRSLDGDPRLRRAVAQSCRHLSQPLAFSILTRLTRDPVGSVSFEAALGLGAVLSAGGRERAHELLKNQDNGLRLGAVLALQESPNVSDLAPLLGAYREASGDLKGELEYEILTCAASIDDDRALELLFLGLASSKAYTRVVARALFEEHFPASTLPAASPLPERHGALPEVMGLRIAPLVEIRTTAGSLVFELAPDAAPLHVHNFLSLAARGAYDGLDFHRVVGDFVIQGGDHRGDGNGARSWRGEPLRAEFSREKFVLGSLGMPRNADPDSGGSQFFVTHRPTPHLDGRYTLFGQLKSGREVLAAIEVGDKILAVVPRGPRAKK